MMKKRIAALLAAFGCFAQCLAGMPIQAAQTGVSLADFAAAVGKLTAQDAAAYEKIDFHKNTGTLYADDVAQGSEFGALSVRGGKLCIKNRNAKSQRGILGIAAVSEPAYLDFEDAAAEYGYQYTVHGDTVTLTNEFQTARLIVKAKGKIDAYGAVSAAEGYRDLHIFQYEDAAAAYSAYQQYQKDGRVQYVQPSHRVTLCDAELAGLSDHIFNTWGAGAIGAESFVTDWLADRDLPEVRVAVIDTGINAAHSLFEGRILEGGINVSDSGDDSIADDIGHGTHCTGTICELTTENVKILPVKVFDRDGSAADEQIYLGLVYAMEQGAQIASMSFGGLGVSPLEIEACALAAEQGMLCVAAAGNNSDDAMYYYPGGIESCLTVGAVDENMVRAGFSNFGPLVDVVAPGVSIVSYTTGAAERTEKMSGTSMATPHVSACCALLKSYDPTLSPERIENLIKLNAKDLGEEGFDDDTAWGLVNLRDFRWDDGICRAPEFSEEPGNYGSFVTLELTTETEGASIYYTTDGTVPTPETGTLYTEPFTLYETAQVIAVSAKEGFVTSAPKEGAFSVGGKDVPDAVEVRDGVLVKYHGIRKTLTVPESVNGARITAVGAEAFAGNRYVTQVILPESVTSLGDSAFAGCTKLTNLTAFGVREIGKAAFRGCPLLESVSFADRMTAAGEQAFADCAVLKELTLDGITEIPFALCSGCGMLETLSMRDVTVIGKNAFYQCAKLKTVYADWERVTEIGAAAFSGCSAWAGDLPLYSLETLGEAVFSGDSNLIRVSLPDYISVLPGNTFLGCSGLRLLQLPGITVVRDHALALRSTRADLVAEINYDLITKVEESAFQGFRIGSGYETVSFSALSEIEYRAFAGVTGGALAFPQVTELPNRAFSDCSLRAVYLEKVKSVGTGSLTGCASAVFSAALEEVAEEAWTEGMWVVTLDEIPVLDGLETIQRCSEPLVLIRQDQELTVQQHHIAKMETLVSGVKLRYQWYTVDGETLTPLEGQTAPFCYAETAEPGEYTYRCIMTDAGGMPEQITYTVNVTEAEEPVPLEPEITVYPGAQTDYRLTVPETGNYTVLSFGAALLTGSLCDSAGIPLAALRAEQDGVSVLNVNLRAGEAYTLSVQPMRDTVCSLRCTAESALISLRGGTAEIPSAAVPPYGMAYQPAVTVTLDDKVLEEGKDYTVSVMPHNQTQTVAVFGIGGYSGYLETVTPIYPRVPADTPLPVSLRDQEDVAVYLFVPRESGTYYYYATAAAGYAAEEMLYYKRGNYGGGSRCAGIRTNCRVCDTPDGSGTVFSENAYHVLTGNFFCGTVDLSAGQPYYFLCGAESAAEYSLVISQEFRNLRDAFVTGNLYAIHKDGRQFSPEIYVELDGTELKKGVDYQQIDINTDLPGDAVVQIVGMGIYSGSTERKYRIIYSGKSSSEQQLELDQPVTVDCTKGRTERLWFRAEGAKTSNELIRYRVLNDRISGGKMDYAVFRYDPIAKDYAMMQPMVGQKSEKQTDYELTDGIYCVVVNRRFANVAASSNFTVLKPYSLNDAEITVRDAVYTGSEVKPEIIVTAGGELLIPDKDFTVSYPDGNVMFGEVHYNIRANKRSFGHRAGVFNIYVSLPEDAPVITEGEHEVYVTFEDRLAVYRVCPEADTTYLLASSDVMDTVLRVFSPEAVMLEQAYGAGSKSLSFTVPAGETRYIMVKFNGTARMGTLHFQLETSLRLLSACEITAEPVSWTGERVLPDLHFTDNGTELEEGKDYSIRYSYNDINPGKATVNCVGMGDYFGNVDVDYQIVMPELFALEAFESIPVALDVTYHGKEETKCPYLVYRYTAGTETALHLDIVRSAVKINVQRYDSEGHWQESLFVKPDGFTEFVMNAGETAYFLLSATDVSGWNQVFDFELSALRKEEYRYVKDSEHGVTYRVLTDGSYAEVYALDAKQKVITLLPEIEGVPVKYITEGLFYALPADTVVIGYSGCGAAKYADSFRFAYQEYPGAERVQGDINGDGRFTVADAVLLSRVLAEQSGINADAVRFSEADCSGDGFADVDDLRLMLRLLAGKESPETVSP